MRVIRSFLALKLSLETAQNLTTAQNRLRAVCKEAGATIRWVPPPNIHVTIRFLGQITEPMSQAVKDMVDPIVINIESFDLETVGIGLFPNERNPRVIWAGLGQGADQLKELYESIYSRLVKAGFNFEDRPFSPHVTLGRVKQCAPETLHSLLSEHESTVFGISTIRHFYCYESDLTPNGAEYTAQWVLPFKRKISTGQESSASQSDSAPPDPEAVENRFGSDTTDNPQTGE